jgi:hypothetical protein
MDRALENRIYGAPSLYQETELLEYKMSSNTWTDNKVRELISVKSAAYIIAEYYCGQLKSTPLGKKHRCQCQVKGKFVPVLN